MKKRKKQAITLLEIMIVIFLIGLIGSVIGYNVKGSMEEGKAFKTEKGIEQIKEVLLLQAALEDKSLSEVVENAEHYLKISGLCKNPAKLLLDGWGNKYSINVVDDEIVVASDAFNRHQEKKILQKKTKK